MDKKLLFNKKTWLSITLLCLGFSILSLFFPILTYTYPSGSKQSFNLIGFMNPQAFGKVLNQYTGPYKLIIDRQYIPVLAAVALLAIAAAFVGVITMSAQRSNRWQFVMAMAGLIGTVIPSVALFIVVLSSVHDFPGSFQFGAYPVITLISMGICIFMVTRKRKLTKEEIIAEQIASKHLRRLENLE